MMRPNCYSKYQDLMMKVWLFLGGGALMLTSLFASLNVPVSYSISFLMGVSLVLLPSLLAHVIWLKGAPSFVPRVFLARFIGGAVLKISFFCALCALYAQWQALHFGVLVLGIFMSYLLTWFMQALSQRGGLVHE